MASFKIVSLLTVLSLLFSATAVTSISTEELDAVLLLLRAQGHMLFANAISTSDLLFDILSLRSLTLLAPTDPTVFALDMTNTPPFYISTLRLHALPLRLSWSQLRLLSNGSSLPTLSPPRHLRVLRRQHVNTFIVDADGGSGGGAGVEVVMPGLYYGRDVAVHSLGGILTFRSKNPPPSPSPVPTINSNRTSVFFPPVHTINNNNTSNRNRTVFFPPVPRIPEILPIINHTIPPVNRTNSTLRRSPATPSNHTNRTDFSPVNLTIVVSPPVRAPSPSPAVLTGSSSGLPLLLENSPSPAPTRAEEPKSRKMSEVLARGEMCAVG